MAAALAGAAFAEVFFGLAFFVAFFPAALAFDAAVVPVTACKMNTLTDEHVTLHL